MARKFVGSKVNTDPTVLIDAFVGKYRFLSNYYQEFVSYNGINYCNTEAAFQAQKCPERAKEFSELAPNEAKRLGRQVKLREGWDMIKDQVMYEIVKAKFLQHPTLKHKLLNTGSAKLVEGNDWGDTYWGQVNGVGRNMLGRILMRIREDFGGYGEIVDD